MMKLSVGAAVAVLFFHTAAFAQQPTQTTPTAAPSPPPPVTPPAPSVPATAPAPAPPPPAPPAPPVPPAPPPAAPYGAPQPYLAPGSPAQPYPAQPYPAQPYPAQPYPAQPYPAQPYPAQPYPAPAPQGDPANPAPPPAAPPAYPYAPPPGYRAPAPYYYYPPPAAHRGLYRPFSISAGLGGGSLSIPGVTRESEGGYSYLVRIGFGLAPDFQVFLGIDGMGISEPVADLTITNYLIGAQYFVLPRLYLRGGIGIASATEDNRFDTTTSAGQGFLAGIGVELAQGDNVSFGLELTSSASRFSAGTYFANALAFNLTFF